MGKGKIARYEHFLLFPNCFQKACFPGASKGVVVWEWVNEAVADYASFEMFGNLLLEKVLDLYSPSYSIWITSLKMEPNICCQNIGIFGVICKIITLYDSYYQKKWIQHMLIDFFIFQLCKYPCNITHDIHIFFYILLTFLEQKLIYHGYFLEHECIFCR